MLASVLNGTELACLDLSNTALDCKRLKMIVNGLEGTSITTLNLSSNKIGVEGLKCLGGVLKNTSITAIDISENKLNYDCIDVFAPYLVGSNITSLNLSSNKVGDDGVNCLANILKNQDTHIESIDLGFNFLFDLQTLADCLPNTRIKSLCLKGNYQSNFQRSAVFQHFSKQLTKITSINLSKCNLSCDDLKLFASGLALSNNTSLKSLILSQSEIDPDGIITLLGILKRHEITHLDISYSCGKQTCSQLLACLNQTSVESLNFEGNEMDYQSLGEGLVNSRINSIYLGYHQLPYKLTSDVRCANFFASLKFNSSITSLKLDCICYADSAIKELVSVLEFTSITSLSLLSLGEFSSECNTLTDLILRLPATKITSLNLNGSKICGNIFYLASVLELTGITSLDLSDCTIFEGNHISEVQNKIDSNDDGSLNLRNRCLCFFSVCYLARQLCQGKFKKLNPVR
ncbi:ribonuclease inhibitor-like [Nilaparvata lugens]|uniref:ribonuclease inhibitor-like n=1 Tax=Nilaparvata lugens TaxID=108931 RepID=UPI00193E01EC|nr:ribonuclease inhibitor-like [Nilaparvata lugens]